MPNMCVGCGVCALKCPVDAIEMINRGNRVIHPETTFERIILLSLERGNLQNQIFDNPHSVTQEFMRSFIGGVSETSAGQESPHERHVQIHIFTYGKRALPECRARDGCWISRQYKTP